MLIHGAKIAAVLFVYMAIFGHALPSLEPKGPLMTKNKDGLQTMLMHSLKMGFIAFLYMGAFGHKLPSFPPKGPLFK